MFGPRAQTGTSLLHNLKSVLKCFICYKGRAAGSLPSPGPSLPPASAVTFLFWNSGLRLATPPAPALGSAPATPPAPALLGCSRVYKYSISSRCDHQITRWRKH